MLENDRGQTLICERPAHKLYPGEWEFPGGKVEPGEDVRAALRRELREELGIRVRAESPLITLRHEYPELAVELDTWLVSAWSGEPRSTEHPAIAWVRPDELPRWPLLAADRPIVNALRLPPQCVFTPPDLASARVLLSRLEGLPPSLVRLRAPRLAAERYRGWLRELAPRVGELGHRLIVDRSAADAERFGAAGFHASSATLRRLKRRPVGSDRWFGASCHDAAELAVARALGADYAVLGPVLPTGTHPEAPVLGWGGFERLARNAGLPVYAIGGLRPDHAAEARRHGGQGVAGIRAFWPAG